MTTGTKNEKAKPCPKCGGEMEEPIWQNIPGVTRWFCMDCGHEAVPMKCPKCGGENTRNLRAFVNDDMLRILTPYACSDCGWRWVVKCGHEEKVR